MIDLYVHLIHEHYCTEINHTDLQSDKCNNKLIFQIINQLSLQFQK